MLVIKQEYYNYQDHQREEMPTFFDSCSSETREAGLLSAQRRSPPLMKYSTIFLQGIQTFFLKKISHGFLQGGILQNQTSTPLEIPTQAREHRSVGVVESLQSDRGSESASHITRFELGNCHLNDIFVSIVEWRRHEVRAF